MWDMIEEAIKSGKYEMTPEEQNRQIDQISKILGVELRENTTSEDMVPIKFKTPLSEEIQAWRAAHYD